MDNTATSSKAGVVPEPRYYTFKHKQFGSPVWSLEFKLQISKMIEHHFVLPSLHNKQGKAHLTTDAVTLMHEIQIQSILIYFLCINMTAVLGVNANPSNLYYSILRVELMHCPFTEQLNISCSGRVINAKLTLTNHNHKYFRLNKSVRQTTSCVKYHK